MPRKSTTSISGPSELGGHIVSPAGAPANHEGDTSILSVATTDASPNSKPPKTTGSRADKGDGDSMGIDDLLLPRTLTSRLARGTLPPNTSIQKDALLALTKAASVFISYLASTSNEMTTKKTIGPQDVLKAIEEIEMAGVMGLGEVGADGKVGGRLERELEVWEKVVRGKRKGYREKVKMRESGVGGADGGSDGDAGEGSNILDDGERDAKRARMGPGEDSGAPGTTRGEHRENGSHARHSDEPKGLTNGAAGPHDDMQEELDDEGYDGASGDGDGEGDETQPDDEEEPEDEDDEEPTRDEDDIDGFGPDDQLRHDMNGDETGDESE